MGVIGISKVYYSLVLGQQLRSLDNGYYKSNLDVLRFENNAMSTFSNASENSVLIHPCKSENEMYSFSFATYNIALHDENYCTSLLCEPIQTCQKK